MGHVEEILLLNKFFFPIADMCLNGEDIAQQSCAMVPRWRFFGESAMAEIRQGKKIERKKKREETTGPALLHTATIIRNILKCLGRSENKPKITWIHGDSNSYDNMPKLNNL